VGFEEAVDVQFQLESKQERGKEGINPAQGSRLVKNNFVGELHEAGGDMKKEGLPAQGTRKM